MNADNYDDDYVAFYVNVDADGLSLYYLWNIIGNLSSNAYADEYADGYVNVDVDADAYPTLSSVYPGLSYYLSSQ